MRGLEFLPVRLLRTLEPRGDSLRCALSVSHPGLSSFDVHWRSIINTIVLQGEKKGIEPDIFTRKLQQKTERELEQLVDKQSSQSVEDVDQSTEDKGDVKEFGGPKGPEPTRYGDWERAGRCSDF
jgi:hypothetical protein